MRLARVERPRSRQRSEVGHEDQPHR
jgi:hypothetical protein